MSLHETQLNQALRAFRQNPTPALASSIKRLRNAITRERRERKKGVSYA
jgi:hypothetical protein